MAKKKLSRRDVLKIGTVATAGTALAPAVGRAVLEPFVSSPDEIFPGKSSWYASTCRQCAAGCGINVRVINGRAKKIEGNPLHPLNKGKLCARGQAGLQVLYNPDRLKNAVRQTGGRGSRSFEPIYWSEALELLADKISSLSTPQRLAFWGGLMPTHLYRLVSLLLDSLGAPRPLIFDLHSAFEGRVVAAQISNSLFGSSEIPFYDLSRTEVVFSFGANFLETWMSPVSQSWAYGSLRQGQYGGRGFVVQFEPRLSVTAASADEWIPLRPGTEGFAALAIGRIIVEERLGPSGSNLTFSNLYQNIDVREMASASELPVEELRRLASIFAQSDQSVAIPGGYLAGQRNGRASMLAVQALNLLAGQVGQVGGVFLSQPGPTPELRTMPQVDTFDDTQELIGRMKGGEVDLLLIHGANPLFELQSAGISAALARVPFIISFNPFVDETAVASDLILPDHSSLESWGYEVPSPGADRPTVSSQQPVVEPLYDTRSTADVILQVAALLGGASAEALPWEDEAAYVHDTAIQISDSSLSAYDARTQARFWALWRQYGGWWSEKEILLEPETTELVQNPLPVVEPEFEGDPEEYPYHLCPYPSIALSDGRGANLPWLQETPDPMTTVSWNTWIELNPETADSIGLENNDIVRVISPFGELEAPVVVYPGIRPDMVAIPVGGGHTDFGRFARKRGSNPMNLVAPKTDPDSGAWAWGATRVRLEPTGSKYTLARLESLDGEGRESIR